MADQDSIYVEPSASTADKNVLQLANEASNILLGLDAQSVSNPKKQALVDQINRTQSYICSLHHNWKFLLKTASVTGYTYASTVSTYDNMVDPYTVDFNNGSGQDEASVSYYAQKYIPSKDVEVPTSLTFRFGDYGYGNVSFTAYAYICPDLNGKPDLDNYLLKSVQYITVNGGTSGGNLFEIPFDTIVPFVKGTQYWVVFELTGDPGVNASVFMGSDAVATSDGGRYKFGSNDWETVTTGTYFFELKYYEGSYLTRLTLPADVQTIYRIYNTSSVDMREYPSDKYNRNLDLLPVGKFVVVGFTTPTNYYQVDIKPGTNCLTYTVLYRTRVPYLTQDTEVPITPGAYSDLYIYDAILFFNATGLLIDNPAFMDEIKYKRELLIQRMELDYRPKLSDARAFIGSFTATESNVDSRMEPNKRDNSSNPTRPVNGFKVRRH